MKIDPLIFLLLAVASSGCQGLPYADRGAALGALTGAVAGGAIGKHNGETAAGAVIGSAVGAFAGAAIGDSIDTEIARNNQLIEARTGRSMAGAVTVDDVITLSQARLSDDVIVTHIRANGVAQRPTPQDLITLTQMGVGEPVIQALQTTPPPAQPTPVVVESPRRVVIEEHHYIPPPSPWFHGHFHRGSRPTRNAVHWGFSYSN